MLLVGDGRGDRTHGLEAVGRHASAAHGLHELVEAVALAGSQQLHEGHLVVVVVKDDDIFVEDVVHVGGVVVGLAVDCNIDVLKVAHGVERGVAIEAAILAALALDVEGGDEVGHGLLHGVGIGHGAGLNLAARHGEDGLPVAHGHAGQRVDAEKRAAVVVAVIVAALHEGALGIEVAQAHVHSHRRVEVGQKGARGCDVGVFLFRSFHILLPFVCCSSRFPHLCRHGRSR